MSAIVEFPTVLFVVFIAVVLVTAVIILRRRFRRARGRPADTDLVGKTCVIRTDDIGSAQAEVTGEDGASQVIRIRPAQAAHSETDALRSGSTALIYDYDNTGGYFVVSPLAKQREKST